MNVLFFTQGSTLDVYFDLLQVLKKDHEIRKSGFFISDSSYYKKFVSSKPEIENGNYILLKEWEFILQAEKKSPDFEKLKMYQEKYNIPNLWKAVLSDRRLIFGPKFSFRQDYNPQFTYAQMMSILLANFVYIEKLFDQVKPDFTSCFICTRVGEYICYVISKARNIPFLNLRPTRIKNYMMFGTSVYEPSELVREVYDKREHEFLDSKWLDEANDYLNFSRNKHASYEGVFLPDQKPPQVGFPQKNIDKIFPKLIFEKLRNMVSSEINYRITGPKCDLSVPGYFIPMYYWGYLNPRLVKKINSYLFDKYIKLSDVENQKFALFPLHKEPEVTLLVYSRHYLNQIEVIRNIAYNLPIDMKLLVKEHPAAVGTRPLNYYKKILNIPNVYLINPQTEVRPFILNSKIVINIAGSVGFEALLMKKPVITFGATPYEILPQTMIRKVKSYDELEKVIPDMIENHSHNEKALLDYIAATMSQSIPIDFYTTLLGRTDQFSTDEKPLKEKYLKDFAQYTIQSYEQCKALMVEEEAFVTERV